MQPENRSVREKVLSAAVQLFAEYGYHAAPLRDIARIAGIQAASIYYHYANKQALLVEIMETYMRQLNSNLERILRKQASPEERLHEAIANHIRLHHKLLQAQLRHRQREKACALHLPVGLHNEHRWRLVGRIF